jgi:hypothetical protein
MKIPPLVRKMAVENQVVQIATSDTAGQPHIAAARGLRVVNDERVAFEDWFCYQTLKNVSQNARIALSIIEPGTDHGYQLIGRVERSVETEVLDGYTPGEEKHEPVPQTKHRLEVKIEKILKLSTGPHADD